MKNEPENNLPEWYIRSVQFSKAAADLQEMCEALMRVEGLSANEAVAAFASQLGRCLVNLRNKRQAYEEAINETICKVMRGDSVTRDEYFLAKALGILKRE